MDTFFYGIFRPAAFTVIMVGLNILAGIAQVLFFIALYQSLVTETGKKFQCAGMAAIIGSSIGLVPKFLAMAILSQHQSLFFFIHHARQIRALCPWLSAFFLLSFCSIVLSDSGIKQNKVAKRAFTAGAAGWFIMFASYSLVVINYHYNGQLIKLKDLIDFGLIIVVATSTTSLICLIVFYKAFITDDFYTSSSIRLPRQ